MDCVASGALLRRLGDRRRRAAQPELARAGGPGAPALLGEHPLGHDDLLLALRVVRRRPSPPNARQVLGVNWRPPLKPLPVLIDQLPRALALGEVVPGGAGCGRRGGRGGQRGAEDGAGDGRAGEGPTGGARSTVTTAVARHGRPPARRSRTSPGEWAMARPVAHRVRSCPELVVGDRGAGTTGQDGERCGSGIRQAGSPSDRGHATTITGRSETWTRPGRDRVTTAGRRARHRPSALLTPCHRQPDRVSLRCVCVTKSLRTGRDAVDGDLP